MISLAEMIIRIIAKDETKPGLDQAKENVRAGMGDVENTVKGTTSRTAADVKGLAKSISATGLSIAAIGGSITTVAVGLQNLGVLSESSSKAVTMLSMSMLVLGGFISTASTITRSYATFMQTKFVASVMAAAASLTTLQIALGVVGIAAIAIVALFVYLDAQTKRTGRSFDEMAKDVKTSAAAMSLMEAILGSIRNKIGDVDRQVENLDKSIDDHEKKVRDIETAYDEWLQALQNIDNYLMEIQDNDLQTQYDRLALADEMLDVKETESGIIDEVARKEIQAQRDKLDVIRAQRQLDKDIEEPKTLADKIATEEQKIADIKKEFGVETLEQLKTQLDEENAAVEQAYADRAEIIKKYKEPLAEDEKKYQEIIAKYGAYSQIKEWEKSGVPITEEEKAILMTNPAYASAAQMRGAEYAAEIEEYYTGEPQWIKDLKSIITISTPIKFYEKPPPAEPAVYQMPINMENVYLTDPKQIEQLEAMMENAFVVAIGKSGVNPA